MRQIDPKFHIDGDQIIKTSNGEVVPLDEPLMLFRGRDRLALPLIRIYSILSQLDGCNDFQLSGVVDRINAFAKFLTDHADRMKQPGITRGL